MAKGLRFLLARGGVNLRGLVYATFNTGPGNTSAEPPPFSERGNISFGAPPRPPRGEIYGPHSTLGHTQTLINSLAHTCPIHYSTSSPQLHRQKISTPFVSYSTILLNNSWVPLPRQDSAININRGRFIPILSQDWKL